MPLRTAKVSIGYLVSWYRTIVLRLWIFKVSQYVPSGGWICVGFLSAHAMYKLWNADLISRLSRNVWHLIFNLDRHEGTGACWILLRKVACWNSRIATWYNSVAFIVWVKELRGFATVEWLVSNQLWLVGCWDHREATTVETFCLEHWM